MMISVLRLLQDMDSKLVITGETGGIEEKICITRSKSRFGQPTSGGWADIMINFYFKDNEEGLAHICEIQLVHAQLYSVRKNMGAHKSYNDFRAALELCEKVGADPEEGSSTTILEALKWKSGPRTSVGAGLATQIKPGKFVAVLESQVEKMDKMALQNEAMASQMKMMSAKMDKMSAALATLTSCPSFVDGSPGPALPLPTSQSSEKSQGAESVRAARPTEMNF
jgi:hypothetical protein